MTKKDVNRNEPAVFIFVSMIIFMYLYWSEVDSIKIFRSRALDIS